MRADVGDHLRVQGRVVGNAPKVGEVVEVVGADGEPPYRVRYPDGRETLLFPGPDTVVEPAEQR